ncbi:Prefoldin subunit [Entamoeba marina]
MLLLTLFMLCTFSYVVAADQTVPIDILLQETKNVHPTGDAYLDQAEKLVKRYDDMQKLISDATKSVQKLQQARNK